MTIEEIKAFDGEVVELEQLETLEESEHVAETQFNGLSGRDNTEHWYSVVLTDGEEIQVYTSGIYE